MGFAGPLRVHRKHPVDDRFEDPLFDAPQDREEDRLRAHRAAEHLDLTKEDVAQIHRRSEASGRAARHELSAGREREDALAEHLASDVFDHHVDAALAGELARFGREILLGVVDDLVRTERLRTRITAFASEDGVSESEAATRMAQKLGVARFGEPEEIANAVAFLASPNVAYCQGTILDVDGGATRTL